MLLLCVCVGCKLYSTGCRLCKRCKCCKLQLCCCCSSSSPSSYYLSVVLIVQLDFILSSCYTALEANGITGNVTETNYLRLTDWLTDCVTVWVTGLTGWLAAGSAERPYWRSRRVQLNAGECANCDCCNDAPRPAKEAQQQHKRQHQLTHRQRAPCACVVSRMYIMHDRRALHEVPLLCLGQGLCSAAPFPPPSTLLHSCCT